MNVQSEIACYSRALRALLDVHAPVELKHVTALSSAGRMS